MKRIAVVAAEASGDQLAEGLIKALKARWPQAQIVGIAGPKMIKAGCEPLYHIDQLSVMGLFEVLAHLPRILRIRRGLIKELLNNPPDCYIGIDAPDFNLGIEAKLKRRGIKTFQFVSPSIWAWKAGRLKKIKQATDAVFCLLPFEPALYQAVQHPAFYVGHPLAEQVPLKPNRQIAIEALKLDPGRRYVGLLPGSRCSELKYILAPFLQAAKRLQQDDPTLGFLLPLAHAGLKPLLVPYQEQLDQLGVQVIEQQSHQLISSCSVLLVASGTVTLEALLLKKPMVVAYKMSKLTYWLAKRLVKTPFISLPNILAQKALVPELIQDQATPELLAAEVAEKLNADPEPLLLQFTHIHRLLRQNTHPILVQKIAEICYSA